MTSMQKAPEGTLIQSDILQKSHVAIDLNELALKAIREAYAVAFGPLPDAMMANDVDSHIIEIIRNAGHAGKHSDDIALDEFVAAMKERMAQKRAEGLYGWDDPITVPITQLMQLADECAVGLPVDRAIYCAMLHHRFKRS